VTVFLVLVVIYGWSGTPVELRVGWETLWILPCLLAAVMFGLAIGMVTSVVALFFRDVIFSMSYFVQMFMFLTPVIYPVRFVPEQYQWLLYVFNPMAQVVIVSRWALLGQGTLDMPFFLLSIGTIAVMFALSVAFFLRAETYLADQM
jgi:lipopolysaccharide transport system permease protein